jgi:hypothetical protein
VTIETDIFRRDGVDNADKNEQALRAVKAFRALQPTLSAYARMLTKRRDISVEMAAKDNGSTDGKKIYYRPPIALGDPTPHDRRLCDKRDELHQPACPACAIRETVLVTIYHEIAHNCYDSFLEPNEHDQREAVERAIAEVPGKYADLVRKKIEKAPYAAKNSYLKLANLISPYLPMLVNALDDARVNKELFKARKGTKIMFEADEWKIFAEGFETHDGVKRWNEQSLNSQIIVGCFCKAVGHDYSEWFAPEIIAALDDAEITALLRRMDTVRSMAGVYQLAFPVLARLRELGFLRAPEDPDTEMEQGDDGEPEPAESGDDSGDEQGDNPTQPAESGDEAGSGDDPESDEDAGSGGMGSDQGQNSGDGEESEGDVDGDSDPEGDPGSDSAEGSDESGSDADGEDQSGEGDDSGTSPSTSEADESESEPTAGDSSDGDSSDESDGSGSEEDSGEVDGDSDSSVEEATPSDDGESDGAAGGDASDPADGDERSGSDDSSSSGAPDSDVPAGENTESPDGPAPDDGSEHSGSGNAEGSDSDGEEFTDDLGRRPADSDVKEPEEGHMDPLPEPDPRPDTDDSDSDEPLDSGADDGTGGVQVVENEKNDHIPMGTPEEVNAGVLNWLDHEDKPKSVQEAEDEAAVDRALVQGIYFETPSRNIYGVREHKYGEPVVVEGHNMSMAWDSEAYSFLGYTPRSLGIEGDFDPEESVLGAALLRARVAFSDNARGKELRHRKSGRVDTRVLGKRAGIGDERLFKKKILPGKKSYFVLIGMDVSGSTVGSNLVLEKKAVFAQAELLTRMGIPFAIYAHSGNYHNPRAGRSEGIDLDIYLIKEKDEVWDSNTQERLRKLGPDNANVDGHTLEYYRKRLDEATATDKIILYYTDGKMPAENHDEELEILQREIRTCNRKGYTLLGVGIRTDSPVRHGLDTVQVDEEADVIKVVEHLEKRLL